MKNLIGMAGILIALSAIAVASFQDELRPEPAPVKIQLKDRVVDKAAELVGIETESSASRDWVTLAYIGLGFLALVAGVISYVKGESHRISGMAGALGVIAIGWEYVLIGIVVAIVIFVLANFT